MRYLGDGVRINLNVAVERLGLMIVKHYFEARLVKTRELGILFANHGEVGLDGIDRVDPNRRHGLELLVLVRVEFLFERRLGNASPEEKDCGRKTMIYDVT